MVGGEALFDPRYEPEMRRFLMRALEMEGFLCRREVIRHEERVDHFAVTLVVPAADAFALEPIALVEEDRRLVPREDVQLELAHARPASPGDRGVEQRATDALPPVAGGDHQPEIGDVRARRVRVAGERQADDPVAVRRDEHGRVGMAAHGLQVAALVADRAPGVGRQEPRARLAADLGREDDQLRRVGRVGGPDLDHRATTPCPPRRGSPAAPSRPFGRRSTAETPPKKRLRSAQARTS